MKKRKYVCNKIKRNHILVIIATIISMISILYNFIYSNNTIGIKRSVTNCYYGNDMQNVERTIPFNMNPLLSSNSSDYTWVGNHFIPPKGIPTYNPIDYVSYFGKRNTLFIGDSTCRRSYASLFSMMTSMDNSNIKMRDIDHPNIIDFNKPSRPQERCGNPERKLFNISDPYQFVCREVISSTSNTNLTLLSENITSIPTSSIMVGHTADVDENIGRFDFIRANCSVHVLHVFNMNETALMEYDLIVIGIGIWEAIRENDKCAMTVNTTTGIKYIPLNEKIDILLNTLSNRSSHDLQIVFRTPGFNEDPTKERIMWDLNKYIKQHERKLKKQQQENHNLPSTTTNFTVVDWGTVISKRSFGEDRLAADIDAHYALEGRLLFAQQLLHELLASELLY